jgi:hypothetical protein
MLKAKFLKPDKPIKFDDAMCCSMRLPPLPSGKKAKRKIWCKKTSRFAQRSSVIRPLVSKHQTNVSKPPLRGISPQLSYCRNHRR